MPQFDQFSFLDQISWFFFFFFFFYFFLTYFFLPQICYNLKFRKKKIIFDQKKQKQIIFEKRNIYFFFNNSYEIYCSLLEDFFLKKISIYNKKEKNKIQKIPMINFFFKKKISFFLNQKFLLFKKNFIFN
uniref:ATP synthase F0 subunit 8 n=1 Tax=Peronosclerospora sorghi TaxID=230839 RepID=UPI0022FD9566|nr:ATP synthase F0 subunit 8 [Peronosclerospora sorghi]WAU47956.1 ATP synthase F0 subunit 8 [Peronosclerospora sorghi]